MNLPALLPEPGRVDEPQALQGYSAVLSQVAAEGKPLIVRRNGEDLAAVIPLQYLEILRQVLARQEVEKLATRTTRTVRRSSSDWQRLPGTNRPPQEWFDDSDNPFEPEEAAHP